MRPVEFQAKVMIEAWGIKKAYIFAEARILKYSSNKSSGKRYWTRVRDSINKEANK